MCCQCVKQECAKGTKVQDRVVGVPGLLCYSHLTRELSPPYWSYSSPFVRVGLTRA